MPPITSLLMIITGLFVMLIFIKKTLKYYFKKEFCALCAAVSATWLGLLALYRLGLFEDPVILALLIGETTVGIFYFVEKKVKEELTLFRLPFLLTLIIIGYSLITIPDDLLTASVFVIVLWGIFALVYVYKSNKHLSAIVKKIIDCCRQW